MSRNDHDVDRPDDDLTAEERAWMDDVPDRIDPPPRIRDLVVARLAGAGELVRDPTRRGPPASARHWAYSLAAGFILAFLVGALAGRATAPSAGNNGPAPPGDVGAAPGTRAGGETQFVLLLYEDEAYETRGRTVQQLVTEYRAWGQRMANEGRLILGEKLADDGSVVSVAGPQGAGVQPVPATSPLLAGDYGALTGFFIVRASSYEEAARLARESPHTTHGGRIVIRRIDPT